LCPFVLSQLRPPGPLYYYNHCTHHIPKESTVFLVNHTIYKEFLMRSVDRLSFSEGRLDYPRITSTLY
jgi:hypothetical protein